MDIVKKNYENQAKTIIKNFERRFIEGYYCETKEDAVAKILELVNEGDSITWGGSQTLNEIGIKSILKKGNYKVIDRDDGKNPEERNALMKQAFTSDIYLTSTNALTMDGELINIDGNGNRVAAMCYGPNSVIVVAGVNKITSNLDTALRRIEMYACAPNSIRLEQNTPCSTTGKCGDCYNDSICAQTVVTRLSRVRFRLKVIIVNEFLGF